MGIQGLESTSGEDHFLRASIELKFNVEGVTLCGGHCAGCMLDAPERQNATTLDDRFLGALAASIRALRDAERAARPDHRLETIVNFGQGDHMLLPHAELVRRLDWVATLRDGDRPVTCFMTVSGIGKPAAFAERVQALHAASLQRGQLLNLDVVLDPVLARATEGARAMLEANVASVLRVFGGCDLHVNVGPDTIDAMTPQELLAFCNGNGITSLTVNLVPTRASAFRFAGRWPEITAWMQVLCERWMADAATLNFNGAISVLRALQASDPAVHGPEVAEGLRQRSVREFYITPDGTAYLAQTGLGDVALTPRSGFRAIGSVHEPERLARTARAGFGLAAQRSGLGAAVHASCGGCRHREACQNSGMRNALAVLREAGVGDGVAEGECPIGADAVFDVIARAYAAGDHHAFPCLCHTGQPHAQAGLELEDSFVHQPKEQLKAVRIWARSES